MKTMHRWNCALALTCPLLLAACGGQGGAGSEGGENGTTPASQKSPAPAPSTDTSTDSKPADDALSQLAGTATDAANKATEDAKAQLQSWNEGFQAKLAQYKDTISTYKAKTASLDNIDINNLIAAAEGKLGEIEDSLKSFLSSGADQAETRKAHIDALFSQLDKIVTDLKGVVANNLKPPGGG